MTGRRCASRPATSPCTTSRRRGSPIATTASSTSCTPTWSPAATAFTGSAARRSRPARCTVREREYPFAWLGILADVAPSTDELIYAHHPDGFALHSMRSPTVSRLYIQVDPGDELDAWPHERVWEALHRRLALRRLDAGRGPGHRHRRSRRCAASWPRRCGHGALLLAGDAAHIVPPTGAKGLNLAVADVTRLAEAMIAALTTGDHAGLDAYSDACLARVWRAQHFSWWMTTLLHADPGADDYAQELRRSQLEYVVSSDAAARSLAENYAGLPLDGAEHEVLAGG